MMQMKMMHRSIWRQARRMHVLIVRYFFKSKSISYHWGRKQRYLISCSSPIFSFALALACWTRRKDAISRNLKLNVRPGTDCPEPLPGYLPSVALECSSSTADMSRISSANALGVWICWHRRFALKLPSMSESLRGGAPKNHLKVKGCIPLQLCKRNKQRRMQYNELEQIMKHEALPCITTQSRRMSSSKDPSWTALL